jgi:hypothetical protein
MKKVILATAVLAALVTTALAAQKDDTHAAKFRAFYANFLTAVSSGDKEKVAGMIAFPVADMDWVVDGGRRYVSIKTKAEFLQKYDTYLARSTRLHLLKARTEALDEGRYAAYWDIGETRFTFLFEYIDGTGYRVENFTTGARR